MEIDLKPTLITKIRLQVLYEITKEIVQSFSVTFPSSNFDSIKKGMLDRQYFKRILIYFLNEKENKVGEARIDIDWEKHFIMASTEGKNVFNFDPTQSINMQVSEALPKIIAHVNEMKVKLGVTKTEVWYTFIDEISDNKEKYEEACKYCGFPIKKQKSPEWEKSTTPKITIQFSPEDLSEFGLTITHEK